MTMTNLLPKSHFRFQIGTKSISIEAGNYGTRNQSFPYRSVHIVDVWEPGIIVENRQKQLLLHTSSASIICQTQ